MPIDSNTTVLVLGTSRGGTTIITAALGSHPDIAMLDEEFTGAVYHITGGKIRGNKLCVPNQLEWNRRYHVWYRLLGFSGFLRKRMLYNLIPRSELSLKDYLDRGPVQPVCIVRNPHAVIDSIVKRERRSAKVAAYRWQRCIALMTEICNQPNLHDNLLQPAVLSFEGLIQAPQSSLENLCQAIGIPFHDAMLDAPSRNERYTTSGFDTTKINNHDDQQYQSLLSEQSLSEYQALLLRDLAR